MWEIQKIMERGLIESTGIYLVLKVNLYCPLKLGFPYLLHIPFNTVLKHSPHVFRDKFTKVR